MHLNHSIQIKQTKLIHSPKQQRKLAKIIHILAMSFFLSIMINTIIVITVVNLLIAILLAFTSGEFIVTQHAEMCLRLHQASQQEELSFLDRRFLNLIILEIAVAK